MGYHAFVCIDVYVCVDVPGLSHGRLFPSFPLIEVLLQGRGNSFHLVAISRIDPTLVFILFFSICHIVQKVFKLIFAVF